MERSILILRLIAYHSYRLVPFIKIDATHSGSRSAERSCIHLVEAYAASAAACDEYLGLAVGENGIEELVALPHIDCIHALETRPGVGLEGCLLDDALLRCKNDIMRVHILLVIELRHIYDSLDLVVRNAEHILDGTALG